MLAKHAWSQPRIGSPILHKLGAVTHACCLIREVVAGGSELLCHFGLQSDLKAGLVT